MRRASKLFGPTGRAVVLY